MMLRLLQSSKIVKFGTIAGGLFVAGCAIMPAAGPESVDFKAEQPADANTLPYALVKLTPKVVEILGQNVPRLSGAFTDRRPSGDVRFGVGDVVSVTIFEAAAGGSVHFL